MTHKLFYIVLPTTLLIGGCANLGVQPWERDLLNVVDRRPYRSSFGRSYLLQ